jgi:hypothetical protein
MKQMKQICLQKSPKVSEKYNCNICDLSTSKLRDFNKHLLTSKHQKNVKIDHLKQNETNETNLSPKVSKKNNACPICVSIFNSRSTLWRHLKICEKINPIQIQTCNNENDVSKLTELVMDVVKQNNELTKQIIELSSKSTITNNNTTNNSFNLHFFLNETCKDALNITDFVNQLQLSVKDLETTGRLGYAEGISKIFINGLKQLDINQRPLHCSDFKRETIYIKDSNQWSKETDENAVLTNAIRDVAHKNIQQIPVWTEEHPEHKDLSSKYNDKYMKLVIEAMPGSTKEESDKNYKKIVRNIMKESVIDK